MNPAKRPEVRMKISLAMIGNKNAVGNYPNPLKGDAHYKWKGLKVGYRALHSWVIRTLGRPKECVFCGGEGKIDWASISHKAKRDLNDYIPLCRSCHKKYDLRGGYSFV